MPHLALNKGGVQQADAPLLYQIIHLNTNIIFIQSLALILFPRYFSDEALIVFHAISRATALPFCSSTQLLIALGVSVGNHFRHNCRNINIRTFNKFSEHLLDDVFG